MKGRQGGDGGKKCQKFEDIICEWSLCEDGAGSEAALVDVGLGAGGAAEAVVAVAHAAVADAG